MIADGDHVMVCLSGGKDSYTLLDILLSLQRSAPVSFEITAVNLDQKQPGFPAEVLPRYLEASRRRVTASSSRTPMPWSSASFRTARRCAACARACAAARLYRFAAENGITKIALGHHRDDIVETLFLNMFFGGRLKAMPPKLLSENRRHIVIRPLCLRDRSDRSPATRRHADFPIIPCTLCGSQTNMQRSAVKNHAAGVGAEISRPNRVDFLQHLQCRRLATGGPGAVRLRGSRRPPHVEAMSEADEEQLAEELAMGLS